MEFSEEWKSLWPISSVFNPPLLLLDGNPPRPPKRTRLEDEEEKQEEEEKTHEEIGPIIFTPCPKSLIQLYSSPSLAPRLPVPYPGLTLARFLVSSTLNSATPLSSITYSVSSHIASEIGSELVLAQHESHDYLHGFNCLQLLRLPCDGDDESWAYLAFFPAGENCEQVGFVKLFLKGNFQLEVELNHGNQDVFVANQKLNSRILQLLVNPVSDFDDSLSADAASSFSSSAGLAVVGYLMACSIHSVYWYAVKTTSGADGLGVKCAKVDFVGQRLFGISEVVHACWSPHLSEESVVLLETGELYLFGISSCLEKHPSSNNRVGMKKLNALWSKNKDFENSGRGGWISVEFSWHPRILIVAHAVAVFLVDARSCGCNLSCLLKIQMLSNIQHDRFIGLCRTGCDGFRFCVTSGRLLMLCDVRQPFRPLLRWVHSLDNPRYITVFRLSELRSNTKDDKWATDSGSCILLGSFWNSEFSLFVYGPNNKTKTVSSEISKFCNSFYAWGLPSEFSLSAYGTHCGRFLIREECLKDALPVWFDWRQKTGVVLGFGIFSRDPLAPLPKSDTVDGFLLIRLTSSGKLEAQRYHAVGECGRISDEAHRKTLCNSQADLLYEMSHEEDDLNIKFNFLNFQYLQGYLNGNLAEILSKERKQVDKVALKKEAGKESNEESMVGDPTGYGSLQRIFDVFKDINLPTSIYEIALRCIWANMPEYLERLALSSHSKYPEAPKFESYGIPFQIPSYCGNTKSRKFLPSKALKQSFLPPPFWLTLHMDISGMLGKKNLVIRSAEEEIQLQCDGVMEAADELTGARTEAESELDGTYAVSLADDTDEINIGDGDVRNFFFHKPVALLDEVCTMEIKCEKFRTWSKRFTTFLYRKQELSPDVSPEMVGLDLLNAGCPIQLTFNDSDISFDPNELKTLKLLKKQHLDFQKGFGLYQEYVTRGNFKK
ncbi:uncharacterized protein [Coffea arabica]|uniref:Uncharacterized protein n=1 Tax=Coffea arabica TaxID=13443 RepID=A0ABM4V6K2_COFAR